MIKLEIRGKFPLGQIVATKNAVDSLDPSDVLACVQRHAACDWGELPDDDKSMNDLALEDEGRILSAYRDSKGTEFWVITEWDRSATTVLLPDDY